jgi:hypothetical protein
VPIGRFSRFWTLGTLQGKIAAAYTFWWVRGMWTGSDERERRLNETHLKAAVQLLGTMSHLRGAVMKLGQLLAHWPVVAPEEFADVWEGCISRPLRCTFRSCARPCAPNWAPIPRTCSLSSSRRRLPRHPWARSIALG